MHGLVPCGTCPPGLSGPSPGLQLPAGMEAHALFFCSFLFSCARWLTDVAAFLVFCANAGCGRSAPSGCRGCYREEVYVTHECFSLPLCSMGVWLTWKLALLFVCCMCVFVSRWAVGAAGNRQHESAKVGVLVTMNATARRVFFLSPFPSSPVVFIP